jgi:hypothetical protein
MILQTCILLLAIALDGPQPSQLEWKAFSPEDGAFAVQMPGTPTEFKKTIQTPNGPVEVLVFELAVPASEGKIAVGYSEFPEASVKPGTEDKRLDNARDGAVASSKGKLKREKSLLLDTHPGRELTIEIEGKGMVVMRLYAVNNRLYQVVAVGPADLVTSQDAQKFLTSFHLKAK